MPDEKSTVLPQIVMLHRSALHRKPRGRLPIMKYENAGLFTSPGNPRVSFLPTFLMSSPDLTSTGPRFRIYRKDSNPVQLAGVEEKPLFFLSTQFHVTCSGNKFHIKLDCL
jgi:hypothetical protein